VSRRKSLVAVWRDAVRDSELDATAKHVAMTLSTWMNGHGACYPSRHSIAAGCSISLSSVDRALRRLEEASWVEIEHTVGGKRRTNSYAAFLPQTASQVRRLEWERRQTRPQTASNDALNGVTSDTRKRLKALESGGAADAASLREAASAPLEDCPGCHRVRPLVAPRFIYCAECAAVTG
jgi:DNA-binding PadR family transcriptional regulator